MADDLTPTTVEHNGRTLSGVGASVEQLEETMARHAPELRDEAHATSDESNAPETRTPAGSALADRGPTTDPSESAETPSAVASRARNDDGTFKAQPRQSKTQARIDELTRARHEAERRVEAEARRAKELEARLAALERGQSQPSSAQGRTEASPRAEGSSAAVPPKPKVDDIGTTYATYEDYLDARDAWNREHGPYAGLLTREQYQQEQAQREADRYLQDALAPVGEAGTKEFGDAFKAVDIPDIPADPRLVMRIASHPQAHRMIWLLGQRPDVTKALAEASLSDPFRASELYTALIEAAQSMGPSLPATDAKVEPASSARVSKIPPAPYQPVGSGSKTTTPTLDDAVNAQDFDLYRKIRAEQRKSGGSR